MKRWLLYIFLLLCSCFAKAQDPHFSQFYTAPLYLSPSLAGSMGEGRVMMNYRNTWPGIAKAYQTYAVAADIYLGNYNSGFGVMIHQDRAGSASLTSSYASFQYSYRLQLNRTWQVVPGFQASFGQKNIDFSKFVFMEDIYYGQEFANADAINILNSYGDVKETYFDLSASVLVASDKLWSGVTVDHITTPEYSFLGEEAKLKMRAVNFGGFNVWTEHVRRGTPNNISFNWRYEYQDEYNQLDLGFYWFNKQLDYGFWYRGVPAFKNTNTMSVWRNRDAMVFILKYKSPAFKIGYSYDLTISDLAAASYGAHEISLVIKLSGIGFLDKMAKKSMVCFPVGQDGRYYSRTRRRIVR